MSGSSFEAKRRGLRARGGLTSAITVALLALPAAVLAQGAPGGGLTNYPTAPRAVPFSETVFGHRIDDPYRWMESEANKPELDRWLTAASAHTVAELHALPGYAQLLADITAASRAYPWAGELRLAGERMLYFRADPTQNQPALRLRDARGDRLLLDPAPAGRPAQAIGSFNPTPDGRFALVQTFAGGGEIGTSRIYDLETGQPLPDVLAPTWGSDDSAWIDNRTIAYDRLYATSGPDTTRNITAYLHHIGTPTSQDVPLFGALAPHSGVTVTPDEAGSVVVAPGSYWMLGFVSSARADSRIAVAPLASVAAGHPQWREIAGYDDRVEGASIEGDTLYYLTMAQVPDGEIRALDLNGGTLATSRRVLGGPGMVLQSFVTAHDGVYALRTQPNGAASLLYVPLSGGAPQTVALPFAGSVSQLTANADGSGATISLMGWLRNATYFRLTNGRATPLGLENTTDPRLAGSARVIEETAVSADGTHVPLTILAPSAPATGPRPTILETYSAYGQVASPFYGPVTLTWVRRGGVYAQCHARGGGELGRAWHEAGREATKPNGQADVIACGERLVQLGLASPATLGAWGTSAGGTIVPPAALRRPDLFRAVTASVSMVNATRLAESENGPMQFAEFGDPRTAAGFNALVQQDSTMLLPQSPGGPDFLFTVGLNDHRVPPWNSAKLAAAMHARWGDRHLALIRADSDAGHGIGSGRDQTLALRADMFAFFLNRFGQAGFVPAGH